MNQNLFLWRDDEAFVRGESERVVAANNGLVLEKAGSRYWPSGYFITQEINTTPFSRLTAAWNADTPAGTSVELRVRVRVRGEWSDWLSYGKYSPFLTYLCGCVRDGAHDIMLDGDTVVISHSDADAFQLRVHLYTSVPDVTPFVSLIGASVLLQKQKSEPCEPVNKCIPVPAYSQRVRNPRTAEALGTPTAMTMLLNRVGLDRLPEEVAPFCYDATTASFDNFSLCAALAGCFGLVCYVQYLSLAALKKEVRHGFPCLVRLRGEPIDRTVVVRGFSAKEDGEFVLLNDPNAPTDAQAEQTCALEEFSHSWTGVALMARERDGRSTLCPPVRRNAELRSSELPQEYAIYLDGERYSLPTDFALQETMCVGTVCFAAQEERVYATSAQRHFYYGDVSANGNLLLDTAQFPTGTRLTVFVIGKNGEEYVSEFTCLSKA